MEPAPKLPPDTPVAAIPGLGSTRAKALDRLGIATLEDLLNHYPRRYEDRRQFEHFPNAPGDKPVCVCGIILSTSAKRFGAMRIFEAIIQEPEGHALSSRLVLRWFNTFYVQKMLLAGQRVVVYGRPKAKGQQIALDHPEFEIIEDDEEKLIHLRRITPIYPGTEGLSQRTLRGIMHRALQAADLAPLDARLPEGLDPLSRAEAIRGIHFPEDEAQKEAARRHLAMGEFFALQMLLGARRARAAATPGAPHCGRGDLLARFHALLPFALTGAQTQAIREIREDLAAPRPMNRLLQGDVGSGKTLVALSAMLLAVEAGFQAALMAPTQILAEQHYLVFTHWLAPLGLRVALRTGARKEGLAAAGEDELSLGLGADIVIGTHALLYGASSTPRLGLAVIDEQHKFGVLQRAKLTAASGSLPPDVLVMTATPIPRTLATTVYGDLDVSTLDESPANRGRIITGVRPAGKLAEAAAFIRDQLTAGRQAYLVYPLVEDSDKLPAKAATTHFAHWRETLAPHRCALLHGRMGAEEKDRIMRSFRAGEIHALVTTTVIEVGIDVKNANVMLVENADRFGLAQLHQLRGRIGRGAHTSYCVLMVDAKANPEAVEKLRVLERSSNGFEIAEADLRLRGAGDILGTAQSGLPPLRIGDLVGDAEWMRLARAAAKAIFADDPELRQPANRAYRPMTQEPYHLLPLALG